jgi:hypothetical protein
LKTIVLTVIVALLLGGIIVTSLDVFHSGKTPAYISIIGQGRFSPGDKLSMRQIDSLSAFSNIRFTIKNSLN